MTAYVVEPRKPGRRAFGVGPGEKREKERELIAKAKAMWKEGYTLGEIVAMCKKSKTPSPGGSWNRWTVRGWF